MRFLLLAGPAIAMTLTTMWAPPAHAVTTGELLTICNKSGDTDPSALGYCFGYVQGVTETELARGRAIGNPVFCMPKNVTTNEGVDLFKRHAGVNVSQHSVLAPVIVLKVFADAFPCKR